MRSWLSCADEAAAAPQSGGVVLFCRDISDRVRRENDATVRASIRSIVDNLPFSGEISGIFDLGIEVTEPVGRRETLARSAAARTAVLEQLTEAVIVTDVQGRITLVNEAARRMHFAGQGCHRSQGCHPGLDPTAVRNSVEGAQARR